MNKNVIVFIVLMLLIAISAVQAYQLTSLKAKVDAGAVKIGGSSPVKTGGAAATAGSGLSNLPTMVGGC